MPEGHKKGLEIEVARFAENEKMLKLYKDNEIAAEEGLAGLISIRIREVMNK